MTVSLAHFAINADDATQAFYEAVFDWTFEPWGPPDFYKVAGDPEGVLGALQKRRDLVEDTPTVGFECTFSVDDVDAVAAEVVRRGGRILMERTTITGVGHLLWFADPSGNAVGAMQYDRDAE